MRLSDFNRDYPLSSALFRTKNCAPQQIISKMLCIYGSAERLGSGRPKDYSIETFRALVAHRLLSESLKEIVGKDAAPQTIHAQRIATLVRHFMPTTLTLHTRAFNFTVHVPDSIRTELNKPVAVGREAAA